MSGPDFAPPPRPGGRPPDPPTPSGALPRGPLPPGPLPPGPPPPASQAPEPPGPWPPPTPFPGPPQRPAVLGMSTTMAVTASVLFICGLGFAWLMAFAAQSALDYNDPSESGLYYLLERFHLRLRLGLAWPLFGLPLITVVLAFFLLARRHWARIAYAGLGLISCGWLVYEWSAHWSVIIWPIGYIAFCVGITWTSSVTRWLQRPRSEAGRPGTRPPS